MKFESATDPDYLSNQVDYSQIDLSNATLVKKDKAGEEEEDDEEGHRKKKQNKKVKQNKKTVISFEELRGSSGVEVNYIIFTFPLKGPVKRFVLVFLNF